MRITFDTLSKIVDDTVTERTKRDPDVLAIYLHGSMLNGQPLLGGTADIDLTIVHEGAAEHREIVRKSDEVTLDITHHLRERYAHPRDLRMRPWLGHTVYAAKLLYDPRHLMDFTQAGVRGMFDRAENVLARAEPQLEEARRIWFTLDEKEGEAGPGEVNEYLRALALAANAVACLNGPPLTERRFLLEFPARAEAVSQPGLHAGFIGLLGGTSLEVETMRGWLPEWEEAFEAAGAIEEPPADLHPARFGYYLRAIEALLDGAQPVAAIWPLLRTWTRAMTLLPDRMFLLDAWTAACDQLELLGEHFAHKLAGLDAYLDTLEELFREWKAERGV